MNLKNVEKKEKSMVELVIEVGREELEKGLEQSYRKNRNQISVPGFRRGKAPRKIIESMYGESVFYEDAVGFAYPEAYAAAVEQEGLKTVSYPQVELVNISKDGFEFKAMVAIYPEVKLGQWKGLSAVRPAAEVTDADVDAEIQALRSRNSRLVSVDRPAKDGDTVVLDFEGFDNGVPFEGGKAEKYSLTLGSGSFVPGFEEQLVGLAPGAEADINVTFPEDYHADLAGKPVVFKVKIHEVKETELPAADDEFAKDVSEFDTLDELKKSIYDRLVKEKADRSAQAFENALLDQVIEGMEAEIPEAMVDSQVEKMLEDYALRITSQGIPFEEYLKMTGTTPDQLKESAKEPALHRVKLELALAAVADGEGLEFSDEEIETEYKEIAERYSMEPEKVKNAVDREEILKEMKITKAAKLVVDAANVLAEPAEQPAEKAEASAEETSEEEKPKKKRAVKKKAADSEEKGE
ncbi:trigger factor [Papillibacter cinnamivorans]|uniref:Trigger factor n=1 Tax=Papillibacter cinnamivorans DSM 12816 TaxID=1122930 RepID=A0A1W1YUD5_9FIRM|nr:trigger factor [Papillibacter cinnamivorans]SMC39754.1 trigger factor [Papillibacter cinnamivorans DSM 12816]